MRITDFDYVEHLLDEDKYIIVNGDFKHHSDLPIKIPFVVKEIIRKSAILSLDHNYELIFINGKRFTLTDFRVPAFWYLYYKGYIKRNR